MAEPIVGAVAAPVKHREPESLEFPGCRPVRITRDEIDDCEDYFEYWGADIEVAMVADYRLSSVVCRLAPKRISRGSPTTQSRRSASDRHGASATNLKRAFASSRRTRAWDALQSASLRDCGAYRDRRNGAKVLRSRSSCVLGVYW